MPATRPGPAGRVAAAWSSTPGADAVYFVDDFGGPSPNGQTNNPNLLH